MASGDIILGTLLVVILINLARALTALRALIYLMREAHPLLYQQVDGAEFFTSHRNRNKQVRLYHYLKTREYMHHHDEIFTRKCDKVRDLSILIVALFSFTVVLAFFV